MGKFLDLAGMQHIVSKVKGLHDVTRVRFTGTTSQTWTVPDDVEWIEVYGVGGGGGGGGGWADISSSHRYDMAGGGGGGGYPAYGKYRVTPGDVLTIICGAGGAGGTGGVDTATTGYKGGDTQIPELGFWAKGGDTPEFGTYIKYESGANGGAGGGQGGYYYSTTYEPGDGGDGRKCEDGYGATQRVGIGLASEQMQLVVTGRSVVNNVACCGGGGGGGSYNVSTKDYGAGGAGGGGNGGSVSHPNGYDGTANTGGGGGGGAVSSVSSAGDGGAGGSGVIYIAYRKDKV